ncbi:hypothetical protein [Solimonas sp. K1W22B-7]|uniref:hypothetical protein n=1 Tax=Solimonas sp. K1W22B-7 TaxID=2303331 RepID=UPI0013C4B0A4|nr:hypothetical protein [Solimonas sp. K1W22B-7]
MDFVEKGFAQASETSKLLITLSTALVAFCAALVNVKAGDATLFSPSTLCEKWLLALSWLALLATTGVGVWTQLAITDVLSSGTEQNPVTPWARKIIVPFQIQILVFTAGVGLLVLYGISKLFSE